MTSKKPITVLEVLQKIRMHVSVPQCDVFGYLSIESEIVILIIPVDHHPKALQVGFSTCWAGIVSLYSLGDLEWESRTQTRGGKGLRSQGMGALWELERAEGEEYGSLRMTVLGRRPGTLHLARGAAKVGEQASVTGYAVATPTPPVSPG